MNKKFLAGILTLGLTAAFCVGCGGEEQVDTVTLVDFAATETETAVEIGELYELRRTVVDEDGNEYVLQYEVKDSTGKSVSVIANCFEITDLAGYTITYTVTVAEGDVRTSVVTLPAYDGDGPTVSIDALTSGAVGETYVLPKVTFSDLSAIQETSVKVYFVGEDLTEITLTESEGNYSFLPTEEGTYRLVAYAKDAAGNETTRTADFSVENILVGEVFNPASANANTQLYFGSNNDVFSGTEKEFVSAAENTDETYGGAYIRMVAANPNAWGNVLLNARFETSEYESFAYVNVWVYVESTDTALIDVLFFNDTELTQKVTPNQWTLVSIDRETFFTHLDSGTYFTAVKYDLNTTGIRIGEVLGVNLAEVEISEPKGLVMDEDSTDVEFSVSVAPENTDFVVVVKNAAGEVQEVIALGNGKYKVTISALGKYTVTATATNGYYGVAQREFAVVSVNRIVVEGTYAESVGMGKELTLSGAHVQRGDTVTEEQVTVKVYTKDGENWVDVSSSIVDGKYTPNAEGMIKVEYTFGDLPVEVFEIQVYDYSVIFNPASKNAASQIAFGTNNAVFQNAKKEFVLAEDNSDETYGGAYLNVTPTNRINWGNVFLTAKFDADAYQGYDAVKAWIYVVSENNEEANALFCYNNYTQMLTPNQWVEVIIPMDVYLKPVEAPVFIALNYNSATTAITGVRIGEIVAVDYAEVEISNPTGLILSGESTDVQFKVTADVKTDFAVVVKNAAGEAQEVVSLGNGEYKVTLSALGEYTVVAKATGSKYGVAEQTFTVVSSRRISVEGTYEANWAMGEALALNDACVMDGETATQDQVTVKVYAKDGENWVDVSSNIVDGKYTPTAKGTIKVEYSFAGVDSVAYEIKILDGSLFFNPASENAASQVSTNGNAFGGGKNATFAFVSDEENTDETYGGAYVKVGSTALTDKNLWGNIVITPVNPIETYAQYTKIKVWVYVEGNGSAEATACFANDTTSPLTFARNQWVQLELSMEKWIANSSYFLGMNFSKQATWGVTGMRIGEITVVK